MRVEFILPSEMEAEVEIDGDTRKVVIRPFFQRTNSRATLGLLKVIGNNGAERKFSLSVSGNSGAVTASGIGDEQVTTLFDEYSQGQETMDDEAEE